MKLDHAKEIAEQFLDLLKGTDLYRAGIAGSIRRGKAEVKDIEIVVEPRPGFDLFGDPCYKSAFFYSAIEQIARANSSVELIYGGDKYKKLAWCHPMTREHLILIDLFIVVPPAQWGAIYTIRTGPGDFSRWLVTPRIRGGAMPAGMQARDGALWETRAIPGFRLETVLVETPTERDYFAALGLEWIDPAERAPMWNKFC